MFFKSKSIRRFKQNIDDFYQKTSKRVQAITILSTLKNQSSLNLDNVIKYSYPNPLKSNGQYTVATKQISPVAQSRLDNASIPSEYTAEEYGDMDFNELMDNDKRDLVNVFWDYTQLHQPVVNTFFTSNKKKLRTIKIALFLLGIVLNFSFAAFFCSDKYISMKFNNSGKTDFWFNLPISIYSSLVSWLIIFLLKLLTNHHFTYKQITELAGNYSKVKKSLIKRDIYRLYVFMMIKFMLFVICWYYTTAFCAAYINSQAEWFQNGIVIFALINLLLYFYVGYIP